MVMLSNLYMNNYNKVLSWRRNANLSNDIDSAILDSKEAVGISAFGEKEVKQLRRKYKQLSDDEIMQAVKDHNNGMTTRQLAEKYDCSHQTISRRLKK